MILAEKNKHNVIPINDIRKDFPQVMTGKAHDKALVYLDNAASTLKPNVVIDAINQHYSQEASNIHRGVHYFSEHGTTLFENTRETIRSFINANYKEEIIFTKGTTDSINLVAQSFGRAFLKSGDEVVISEMEHHSNIVPWQMLRDEKGIILKVIPINDNGELILEEFKNLLSDNTKLVSITHASNTLGTINPIQDIIKLAHEKNAKVLIDGAQAIAHTRIDVQNLDCDFYAFSGHKIYGPTGTGVLYGKKELLEQMPPVDGGGDMIDQVTFEKTTYNDLPHKFEAGTPHIAGFIGLKPAIDYVTTLGFQKIHKIESELLKYATERLSSIEGLRIIGTAKNKTAVISFVIDGVHPHDLGTLLDMDGIAIRTGHHCTQPLMKRFGVPATARASFSIYNTKEEVDALVNSINKAKEML